MASTPSSLFSAIVLSGIALTGGSVACGSESNEPSAPTDGSASASGDSGSGGDGATDAVGDAATGSDASTIEDAGDGGCPPGSERPVPPCDLIK